MARPHVVLGVPEDASLDALRAAYKRLASKHHPDKGGDIEQFRQVQAAYEALSAKRAAVGPFDDIIEEIAKELKQQ